MPLHPVVVAADIDLLPGKRRQEVVVVRQPLVDVSVWRCFIEADDKSVIWGSISRPGVELTSSAG